MYLDICMQWIYLVYLHKQNYKGKKIDAYLTSCNGVFAFFFGGGEHIFDSATLDIDFEWLN
jgi:hypothetical protein